MRDYVFHIHSPNYCEGCGFFLGGRFYTCAHVVNGCDEPYIIVSDKKVLLEDPVFLRYDDKDEEGYDVAVFDLPLVESPLVFADGLPAAGESMESISWRSVPQGSEYVRCDASVLDVREGNYFYADTDVLLREGSSGSPLLKDGKVYGMLCAGSEGTPLCAFLSAESIGKLISEYE